jgi:hypothetical protein
VAKLKKYTEQTGVTADFILTFRAKGGPIRECVCGRIHFCLDCDLEDDEIKEMTEGMTNDPERYIEHGEDDITCFYYQGEEAVFGCSCGYDCHVETMIWLDRKQIVNYLAKRAANEAHAANRLANGTAAVKAAFEKI